MQDKVDLGLHAELLDAENVALSYLANVWDWDKHIVKYNIEFSTTDVGN